MKIFLCFYLLCFFSTCLWAGDLTRKNENSDNKKSDCTLRVSPYWGKSSAEKIELMKNTESRMNSLRINKNAESRFELAMYYIEKEKYIGDRQLKKILRSAQKGYSLAQSAMGDIHERQRQKGKQEDAQEALHWYKLAAAQDEPNAMYNLGRIYRDGCGVKKNTEKARMWFEKAAKKKNEEAKKALLEMTKS